LNIAFVTVFKPHSHKLYITDIFWFPLDKVRNIGITKSPNRTNYAEGATSITLECSAEGKHFWYLFHVLPVELYEISCKSVECLFTENIKRGNQEIIV
jgi:hypothetical protein